MAWCRQARSHYLNQCWRRSPTPYGVTRPQWVKECISKCMLRIKLMRTFLWNCSHVNHLMKVDIDSDNALIPSGNNQLPEPTLTQIDVAIWWPCVTMSWIKDETFTIFLRCNICHSRLVGVLFIISDNWSGLGRTNLNDFFYNFDMPNSTPSTNGVHASVNVIFDEISLPPLPPPPPPPPPPPMSNFVLVSPGYLFPLDARVYADTLAVKFWLLIYMEHHLNGILTQ